jgi:hypothetical protein
VVSEKKKERLMKRQTTRMVVGGLVTLLVVGLVVLATGHWPLTTQRASVKVTYYCPMHPTYTSDRPGDCPICNMKLVKREDQPPSQQTGQSQPQSTKDICYMHTCPMVHEGKPCPMLVVAKAGEPVTCPICGTHVVEAASAAPATRVLYWTDPMIPGYKSDKPGKSPMGMDLIPVYGENAISVEASTAAPEGYAPILITPQKRQFIGVTTAPAQRRTLTKTIRTVGIVAHDPELYQAQEEFIQARWAWEQAQGGTLPEVTERAQRLVQSSRLRLRHLGLSEEMIDEVGTWTQPDHRLLLGGAGQFWVYVSVYEYELPLIQQGQHVDIETSAVPGVMFSGTVRAIDPMLDPATRSVRVRVVVEDPQGVLKPEMFVNASIQVAAGEVLAIPEEAVFDTGTKKIVFVDKGEGLFEPRDVEVGVKAEGSYEITSGVAEGELVVTSGNFLIDSESRLKAALEGMTPRPADGGQSPQGSQSDPASGQSAGRGVSGGGGHQHGGQ